MLQMPVIADGTAPMRRARARAQRLSSLIRWWSGLVARWRACCRRVVIAVLSRTGGCLPPCTPWAEFAPREHDETEDFFQVGHARGDDAGNGGVRLEARETDS